MNKFFTNFTAGMTSILNTISKIRTIDSAPNNRIPQDPDWLTKEREGKRREARQEIKIIQPAISSAPAVPEWKQYRDHGANIAMVALEILAKATRDTMVQFIDAFTFEEPTQYKLVNDDDNWVTLPCVHAHCESGGTFEFSEKILKRIQGKGWQPKNCYECKSWAYEINKAESVKGNCEKCGKPVMVEARRWIGYHKYKGAPRLELFCGSTTCRQARTSQSGSAPKVYGNTAKDVLQRTITKDPNLLAFLDIRESNGAQPINVENGVNNLSQTVPIVLENSELVDLENGYYENALVQPGSTETRLEHIDNHLSRTDKSLATKFDNAKDVIEYAHEIACIHDPSRFVDFDQGEEGYVRFDSSTFIKFAFIQNPHTRLYNLKTAFIPGPVLRVAFGGRRGSYSVKPWSNDLQNALGTEYLKASVRSTQTPSP